MTCLSTQNPTLIKRADGTVVELTTDQRARVHDSEFITIVERSFRLELTSDPRTPLGPTASNGRSPTAVMSVSKAPTPKKNGNGKENGTTPTRERRSVCFGKDLSPELFDKNLPPSTPIKKGSNPKKMPTPLRTEVQPAKSLAAPLIELEEELQVASEQLQAPAALSRKLGTPLRQAIQGQTALRAPRVISAKKPPVESLHDQLMRAVQLKIQQQPLLAVDSAGIDDSQEDGDDTPPMSEELQRLQTPLRMDIVKGASLRSVKPKPALKTPIRAAIRGGVRLNATRAKAAIPTPVREAIESRQVTLKSTKPAAALNTPVRHAIRQGATKLRNTKPRGLKTPVRKAIVDGIKLRSTRPRPALATPVREAIKKGEVVLKSKMPEPALQTPVRAAIKDGVKLRTTRPIKAMQTPVRQAIKKGGIMLKCIKPRPALQTPVRKAIRTGGTQLRSIKPRPALNTPVRLGIKNGDAKLRSTKPKNVLGAALCNAIAKGATLNKVLKKGLKTPVREAIRQRSVTLRSIKPEPTLDTPTRKAIVKGVALRSTRPQPAFKTPVREAIRKGRQLKCIKPVPAIATVVRKAIQEGVTLKCTKPKKVLNTPLRNDIIAGTGRQAFPAPVEQKSPAALPASAVVDVPEITVQLATPTAATPARTPRSAGKSSLTIVQIPFATPPPPSPAMAAMPAAQQKEDSAAVRVAVTTPMTSKTPKAKKFQPRTPGKEIDVENMLVKDLKDALMDRGVEFSAKAKKAELKQLLFATLYVEAPKDGMEVPVGKVQINPRKLSLVAEEHDEDVSAVEIKEPVIDSELSVDSIKGMKVVELKVELTKLNLSTIGRKADLQERLCAACCPIAPAAAAVAETTNARRVHASIAEDEPAAKVAKIMAEEPTRSRKRKEAPAVEVETATEPAIKPLRGRRVTTQARK